MLTSLFGDLEPPAKPTRETQVDLDLDLARPASPFDDSAPDEGFAATAILESTTSEMNDRGLIVDRHQSDLVVTGSAAFAIREHFTTTRADMEFAARMITMVDPTGVWASSVIKALSDATGRPIERMHLREQTTLKTLAVVERTVLIRRQSEPLKIYHADVRAPGRDNAEIPMALIERSHLTAVIVGPLKPHGVDELLRTLAEASARSTWACANLLFMLPPNAVWIANKVKAITWPRSTRVICIDEPLISSTTVWNAMLGVWNRVKQDAVVPPQTPASLLGLGDFPIKVADLPGKPSDTTYGTSELGQLGSDSGLVPFSAPGAPATAAATVASTPAAYLPSAGRPATSSPAPTTLPGARSLPIGLSPERAAQSLAPLLGLDGLLACAVVDARSGFVIAHELRGAPTLDLTVAAGSAAQAYRTQRQMARQMGITDRVEEMITNAGNRQVVLRCVSRHPDAFIIALLDKTRSNVALVRYKVLEAERSLA
jgi:hypothetical protein